MKLQPNTHVSECDSVTVELMIGGSLYSFLPLSVISWWHSMQKALNSKHFGILACLFFIWHDKWLYGSCT